MKTKKREMVLCGLCDQIYEWNGPDHKIHEHPEPQSGLPRTVWLVSKLNYKDWIETTTEGKKWHKNKRG